MRCTRGLSRVRVLEPVRLHHFYDSDVVYRRRVGRELVLLAAFAGQAERLSQIGGALPHHNRAWQYAGDFPVSGVGGVDGDASNLLLAPRPGGTNRARTAHREVPAACGALRPADGLARGESAGSCDGHAPPRCGDDGNLDADE